MEKNLTLEKVLIVCNRNAELLVGATIDSKVAFLSRMRKKNLIILKSLIFFLFYLFVGKCSENCNMLTECTAGQCCI